MGKNKEVDLFDDMIPAIDLNIKDLWDASNEAGQKEIKGDMWNLNRYISSVKGSREKQELAIFKTNEYYNKNWNAIGVRHPKLQWQLLCISGNTGKKEFHPWIGLKQAKGVNTKAVKFLEEIYPTKKIDEIELIARIFTKAELEELARAHGYEKISF
jgi:hypothetical protein